MSSMDKQWLLSANVQKPCTIVSIFSELNKRCTTGDPRLAFTKDASTKDTSIIYGHQSNALQILYGTDLSDKTAIVTGANTGIGKYFV